MNDLLKLLAVTPPDGPRETRDATRIQTLLATDPILRDGVVGRLRDQLARPRLQHLATAVQPPPPPPARRPRGGPVRSDPKEDRRVWDMNETNLYPNHAAVARQLGWFLNKEPDSARVRRALDRHRKRKPPPAPPGRKG